MSVKSDPLGIVQETQCWPYNQIESSYRSWDLYTTGQLVDGLQQKKKKKKKENQFSLNGNRIMSFQWRQFYHSTRYKPVSLLENEMHEIHWKFDIQPDHLTPAGRSHLEIIYKEREHAI